MQEYKKLSEFINGTRKAVVSQASEGYKIDYFQDDDLVRTEVVKGHSEYFAEDMADNWCQGILN